jgi:hypothetical protein
MAQGPAKAHKASMSVDPIVAQRWRSLRELLIQQLEMFETGRLTLHTGGVDVSHDAISTLRREILEFDALILAQEQAISTPRGAG